MNHEQREQDSAMPDPEAVVLRQLTAYNNHDLEAYVETFSPDVQLFELPGGEEAISGREALRAHYAERFRSNPELRGEVVQRMVSGSYVIYHEVLWGLVESEAVELMAIYQIDKGLIRRIWFIRA
jgi:hypothetical protein